MITLYTPTEEAILDDYFEIRRPDRLKEVDIYATADAGIHVTRHGSGQFDIPHAVARLALSRIQKELPQWACRYGEEMLLGRDIHPHHVRKMELRPRHLFSIIWADTAPGISWPEVYHLVCLPGFDRYVITASADSDDAYGVTDFALGWFPKGGEQIECVKTALIRFWRGNPFGWDQFRWEYVSWPGEISEETANQWPTKPGRRPSKIRKRNGQTRTWMMNRNNEKENPMGNKSRVRKMTPEELSELIGGGLIMFRPEPVKPQSRVTPSKKSEPPKDGSQEAKPKSKRRKP